MKLASIQKSYFHGTTYKRGLNIVKHGFDPKSHKFTMHGEDATYFSPDMLYAMTSMGGEEHDLGTLFEVDLDGLELHPDKDLYAKGSVYVKGLVPSDRIIGIYIFGHPQNEAGVFDVDDHFRTKCLESSARFGSPRFKKGDIIRVPMSFRF